MPKQDCCGLPLQSSGLFDDARKVVLRLARALREHVTDEDTIIVGNATSCTLMLKREAREILSLEDDPDLKFVSERTYDICELLLELHDRGELKTDFSPINETVAYHAPCQQQGHWVGKPALDLLALVPGLEVKEMNARCCGIAGTYGLKAEKYEIAMAVGRDLFDQVAASGAPTVACDSRRAAGRSPTGPSCPRCIRSTTCTGPTASSGHADDREWSGSSSSPTAMRSPRAWCAWPARWPARSWRSSPPAASRSPASSAPTPSGCGARSSGRCPRTGCSC